MFDRPIITNSHVREIMFFPNQFFKNISDALLILFKVLTLFSIQNKLKCESAFSYYC